MVRTYQKGWLPRDLTAGLILTALLVPQGMAYAELAGLPPITGLYTSILCLVGYGFFGPSKVLVLGPDSSLGPMIAATILPLVGADGDPARAIALASMLALLVGAITAAAGLAKFGFVADLLSKPTMIGYMNGLALTILVGQLPKLFGFSVEGDKFLDELKAFVKGVAHGKTVPAALAVGLFAVATILVIQRWAPKIPSVLIAVLLSILATVIFDLASHGVSLVGSLPRGFPPFTIPHVELSDFGLLIGGAFGIAVVSLADTISTASSFAARSGTEIDGSREMVGIGAANIAAGLFQGFPVSTSGSRTAVAEQAKAKTQVTGLVGAAAITLLLLVAPGLLRNLPQPTLAAVVMVAAISLADIGGAVRLLHRRPSEFWVSITAFLGVTFLGVLAGIAIAVALSVGNVFRQVWWPHQTRLGRVSGIAGYHDVSRYPQSDHLPGCALYRFDAPLIFANARTFKEHVRALATAPEPPLWIIVDAGPVTELDTTAADMLADLHATLSERGITLAFADVSSDVRKEADVYGLTDVIGPSYFFPTLDDAITAFRMQSGVDWVPPPAEASRTRVEARSDKGSGSL
jgi:high affinity sulfate transporter 1